MRYQVVPAKAGKARAILLIAIAGLLVVALTARIISRRQSRAPVVVYYECDTCGAVPDELPTEAVLLLKTKPDAAFPCLECERGRLRVRPDAEG